MKNKHYHKYKLKNLSRDPSKPPYWVYICIKQDCTHHIRVELIDGKISECNRCGDPFVMNLRKLTANHSKPLVNPHCEDCTKTKGNKKQIKNVIDEMMDSILPGNLK